MFWAVMAVVCLTYIFVFFTLKSFFDISVSESGAPSKMLLSVKTFLLCYLIKNPNIFPMQKQLDLRL